MHKCPTPQRKRTGMADWPKVEKSGTGGSLHTQEPVTVASFRTWRGWREYVARDRCLTKIILARKLGTDCRARPTCKRRVTFGARTKREGLPFFEALSNNRSIL